jgi:ankyrin repeat protein
MFYRTQALKELLKIDNHPKLFPPYRQLRLDMPLYSNAGDVLNAAASQSSIAMIDLLISHGAKIENSTALNHAASSSNEDAERLPIMEHLVELGADINGTNLVGCSSKVGTSLYCTVKEGKPKRARSLLHNGADPHKKNC